VGPVWQGLEGKPDSYRFQVLVDRATYELASRRAGAPRLQGKSRQGRERWGHNFQRVAFETNLPRIEAEDSAAPAFCNRQTGKNCVNPPPGAHFYPIFSTTRTGGSCEWQEGGPYIPNTTNTFGGNSRAEFGVC